MGVATAFLASSSFAVHHKMWPPRSSQATGVQSGNWRTPGASGLYPGPSESRENRDTRQQREHQSVGPRQDQAEPSEDGEVVERDSIAEGRRIYLGNLLYRVKPYEVEEMLAARGFGAQLEAIHISVDPVTGRNPGYCFIDFTARPAAEDALRSLGGVEIQRRPVKVGPCQPKGAEKRWKGDDGYSPTFQRWGDWKGSRSGSGRFVGRAGGVPPSEGVEQGPYGAIDHLRDARWVGQPSARVYVGGLGKMINQGENDKEIRGYFDGFKIVAISKRITPHPDTRSKPGNHHYCFIDFATVEDAQAAIKALKGKAIPGGYLRLGMAGVPLVP